MNFTAVYSVTTTALALLILTARDGDGDDLFLLDSPELKDLLDRYQNGYQNRTKDASLCRGRRSILWSDREDILKLHNKLRGGVYPSASNMEPMVRVGRTSLGCVERWAQLMFPLTTMACCVL